MSLESPPVNPRRRLPDAPQDKPVRDRIEHANLDRPGAVLHPRAGLARLGWPGLVGRRALP